MLLFSAIANSLDKNTIGYLTWKAGMHSGMSTMVVRETMSYAVVANVFFGIPHTFCSLSYSYKISDRGSKFRLVGK